MDVGQGKVDLRGQEKLVEADGHVARVASISMPVR